MAGKSDLALEVAKTLGLEVVEIKAANPLGDQPEPCQVLDEKLTDWCGKDRDLDSVIWAAAQDDDVLAALVATVNAARRDYIREMEEAYRDV